MQYITYEDYVQKGGTMSATSFDKVERMAERKIDRATFGRIKAEYDGTQAYAEDLQALTLVLLEFMDVSGADSKKITSESADGFSQSYQLLSQEEADEEMYVWIEDYLYSYEDSTGTELLYAGV